MDHFNLNDELRQKLLESASWGSADITPRLDERNAENKARKNVAHTEYEDGEEAAELSEDAHVCPLCVSQLEEAIEEERILEHLNVILGLVDRLSQLQEGDEDIETVIDETIAELLLQDIDEE